MTPRSTRLAWRLGIGLVGICLLSGLTLASSRLPVADPGSIAAAIAHPARSGRDIARDARSHPEAVLQFLNVRPGMTVFELLGGDGYYGEILARAVGPQGTVYLHNNQGYQGLMRSLPRRLQGSGMDALQVYVREIADINLASESVDLVLMVKVYHDLYYLNNGWAVTPDSVFQTLHRILKPGGMLAVIDHRAPDGTGPTYAQNLHRIAADFSRQDIASRGFRFDGESRVLQNAADDLKRSVFEPDLRGHTDRFLHRYRKVATPSAERPVDQPSTSWAIGL